MTARIRFTSSSTSSHPLFSLTLAHGTLRPSVQLLWTRPNTSGQRRPSCLLSPRTRLRRPERRSSTRGGRVGQRTYELGERGSREGQQTRRRVRGLAACRVDEATRRCRRPRLHAPMAARTPPSPAARTPWSALCYLKADEKPLLRRRRGGMCPVGVPLSWLSVPPESRTKPTWPVRIRTVKAREANNVPLHHFGGD
nr:unnamed protein product [Digitaria exilis]